MGKSLPVNPNPNKHYNIRKNQTITRQDDEQSNVNNGKLHKGKLDLGGNH